MPRKPQSERKSGVIPQGQRPRCPCGRGRIMYADHDACAKCRADRLLRSPKRASRHFADAPADPEAHAERVERYAARFEEGLPLFDATALDAPRTYLCTLCGTNPVDAEQGFDTCEECLAKQ